MSRYCCFLVIATSNQVPWEILKDRNLGQPTGDIDRNTPEYY